MTRYMTHGTSRAVQLAKALGLEMRRIRKT